MLSFKASVIKCDGRYRVTVFRRCEVSLFKRGLVSLFQTGVIQHLLLTKGDSRTRVTAVIDETARNTVATHMIKDKCHQQEEELRLE